MQALGNGMFETVMITVNYRVSERWWEWEGRKKKLYAKKKQQNQLEEWNVVEMIVS